MDAPAPGVHQGAVFQDPGVEVVDVEPCPDGRLDEGLLLGGDGRVPTEVG
jgi:hypothetical protein